MLKRPSVLIMVDSFDMGGAEGQTVLLTQLLLQDGRYGVHLACLRREGVLLKQAEQLGLGEIPEYRLTSFYDRNMIIQLRRLVSYLRQNHIDVVHPQSFYTNVFAITAAAMARVPVRIAFRGETEGWRTAAQNFVERSIFRLATAVHANSDAVKSYLVQHGVPEGKIITVHNGIDMARVTPLPELKREKVLDNLGLPRAGRFVTIVANMRHEVKDHPTFLRAAQRVSAAVPEAIFLLAGEGELTKQLQDLAAELGLRDRAFFIGHCQELAQLLFVSDVCVLSSKAEGFSNVVLEYMAAARPVVATNVGGTCEAVEDGRSGYLVSPGDDETMAERITCLLRTPHVALRMGALAKEIVELKFSAAAQLQNTQAMYASLLER